MEDPESNLEQIRKIGEVLLDPELAIQMVERGSDAIVVVKDDLTIFFVNAQAELLFGYPRTELYGRPVTVLMPEAVRQKHEAHTARYMEEPRVRPMGLGIPLRGLKKNGTEFEAEINLTPLVSSAGTLVMAAIRKKR